jgi:hypothetical protein
MRSGSAASASLSPHTRLADGDRTDTGHHLALRQVTVPDDAPVIARGLQIGMLAEKVSDLGLDRMSPVKVDRDAAAGDAAATLASPFAVRLTFDLLAGVHDGISLPNAL